MGDCLQAAVFGDGMAKTGSELADASLFQACFRIQITKPL